MAKYDYDLFVIGAGSGGVRAARLAAMSGARVGVAEEHRVGGTCVIRGCVPKKFMVYASEFAHEAQVAEGYGWSASGATFDWKKFLEAKDREIARLSGIYVTNLSNAGAEIIHAKARLLDAHTVELVGKGTVTADKILIATGGRPWKPTEIPGSEHVITSEEAFHLPELPKRILIAGGGYIAVEFAGIFNGMGSEVTLVYRRDNILRGFDEDLRAHLRGEIERRGIRVITHQTVDAVEKVDHGLCVTLSDHESITVDQVMFATGRRPNVSGIGLDKVGVLVNAKGAIEVNKFSQTSVPHIYAVGDVTDRVALTPVAIREGHAFADTVFGGKSIAVDHTDIPTAVFSEPEVGVIGLTEAEARRDYARVDIYKTSFRPMKATLAARNTRSFFKLVVDGETDRVLGCHIVGPDAGELIQVVGIAIKMRATKADFDTVMAVHPTAAEELVTMRTKAATYVREAAAE